jgi:nitrate reductase NapE component
VRTDSRHFRQARWRAAVTTLLILVVAARIASGLVTRMRSDELTTLTAVVGLVGLLAVAAIGWYFVVPMWRRAGVGRSRRRGAT